MTFMLPQPRPVDDADRPLVSAAIVARQRAYCPYSGFAVGAAVRSPQGQIYPGCNVENASYGLTTCAERVAVLNAVVGGATAIEVIAVAAPGRATPCGACRQVLVEFGPAMRLLLVDPAEPELVVELTLADLLPGHFSLDAK